MDRPRVEQAVIAVLAALWRAVGGLGGICRTRLAGEYADLRSELPKDFQKLLDDSLAAAPPLQVDEDLPEAGRLTLDEFLDRVAERAGVDRERARQAAEAVRKPSPSALPAARSRIDPAGAARASACLEAGVNRSRGRAMRLSLQAFLREIARLEHRPRSEATKDGRAVLAVLRESVGEKEFHDTTSQLPGEFQIHLKQETG
jgi:uncharacterized protein (DUF2267 family)